MSGDWTTAVQLPEEERPRSAPAPKQPRKAASARAEKWALAALTEETSAVRTAGKGARNDTLNKAAFALGQLVGGGYLNRDDVVRDLTDAAAEAGLPKRETKKTIASGLAAGEQDPRQLPESEQDRQRAVAKDTGTDPQAGETWEPKDEQAPGGTPAGSASETPPVVRTLGDLLAPALERAELRRSGKERPVPVPFPQYAEILQGGFWPGVHVHVAGTGVGKSTFNFQTATYAAQAGIPVFYIGLELGEMQVGLRAVAEASSTSWSRMYVGRCSERDLDRAREAIPALAGLPFYVEFNTAQGWAPSNMVSRVEQIRKLHPSGPLLVVLDFMQLVGAEPVEFGRAPDIREKISKAAYCGVHVANKYGAAVVMISSAARDKYALLAGDVKAAGLTTRQVPGFVEPARTIMNPDALIGIGKESGEIEFAAESQTVLIRWPALLDNGEKAIICAVPKLRYSGPSWVAMSFWQRFAELPFRDIDELPEVTGRGSNGRDAVPTDEYTQRLLETIRSTPGLKSQNDVLDATKGKRERLAPAFKALLDKGLVVSGSRGFEIPEEGTT
ncbi:MAG TPA: DnaB-like helicase C-terminal domain-containing protein [Polyangiaceae bacterium]|nr:DnaB-like helicase C-terminal domain-containing protein [Polyangiaceae bacterium]